MRRAAVVLLLLAATISAQVPVAVDEVARIRSDFAPRAGEQTLNCDVTPLAAFANFAFLFEAGYVFHVSQSQYFEADGDWIVFTSIHPDGHPLEDMSLIHRVPRNRAVASGSRFDIRGLYFLGAGSYSVESTLRDGRDRVCRKQWRVVVPALRVDRSVPSKLPPYKHRPIFAHRPARHAESRRRGARAAHGFIECRGRLPTPHDDWERRPRTNSRCPYGAAGTPADNVGTRGRFQPGATEGGAATRRFQGIRYEPDFRRDRRAPAGHYRRQRAQESAGSCRFSGRHDPSGARSSGPRDTIVFLGPTSRYWEKFPKMRCPGRENRTHGSSMCATSVGAALSRGLRFGPNVTPRSRTAIRSLARAAGRHFESRRAIERQDDDCPHAVRTGRCDPQD
jgi:hypothetical protein